MQLTDKKYFLVTSHGRAATYWLAASLNSHPEVICSHGPNIPPMLDYPTQPPDQAALNAHAMQKEFYEKSLDEVFIMLEQAGKGKVFGNVHAYSAYNLYTFNQLKPGERKPVVYNLVRHPITHIESLKRRLLHEMKFSPFAQERLEKEFNVYVMAGVREYLQKKFNVDFKDPEVRASLYSNFYILIQDILDFDQQVEHIPMERLTKDVDYYTWFFSRVTQGAVDITTEYLDEVFSGGRKNFQADEASALKRYSAWEPWRQAAFKIALEAYDLQAMYEPLGYGFSFVKFDSIPSEVVDAIPYPVNPRMVETNYQHYQILRYRSQYYGLSPTLGQFDVTKVDLAKLKRFQDKDGVVIDASIEKVKERITWIGPRIELMNYQGCNIIYYQGKYHALPASFGGNDVYKINEDMLAEFRKRGMCISVDSLEALQQSLNSSHNEQVTGAASPERRPSSARNVIRPSHSESYPWRRSGWDAKEINPISSMICEDETLYLHWLARQHYQGLGEIVDGGCLLGGSTVSLASGLMKNERVAVKDKRIHSYDLFIFFDGFKNDILRGSTLKEGESLLPLFMQNTQAYKNCIEVHPGDILNYHWSGKPVEILFIDLAKSWEINNHVIKEFFGHLIPNQSIVVHQDYHHYFTHWIHLTMQFFAPYFEMVHTPDGGSVGFLLTQKIPEELLKIDYRTYFTTEQAVHLLDEDIARLPDNRKLFTMTCKIRLLAERKEFEKAAAVAREIRQSPYWEDVVLYDVINAENHIPASYIPHRAKSRGVIVGMSRNYNLVKNNGQIFAVPIELDRFDVTSVQDQERGDVIKGNSLQEVSALIGEVVLPPPSPLQPTLLSRYSGYNIVLYADVVYGLPLALGPVNITNSADRQRAGILQAENEMQVKKLIDQSQGNKNARLIEQLNKLPILNMEEIYRGYSLFLFENKCYALIQSIKPGDLIRMDRAAMTRLRDEKKCFIGKSFGEVKAQIDRLA